MKVWHKTTINARCPTDGNPPDTYEVTLKTDRLIPVETIDRVIVELTAKPIFQEELTRQLASVLGCTAITRGMHRHFETIVKVKP